MIFNVPSISVPDLFPPPPNRNILPVSVGGGGHRQSATPLRIGGKEIPVQLSCSRARGVGTRNFLKHNLRTCFANVDLGMNITFEI